jgi:hypothetical protein
MSDFEVDDENEPTLLASLYLDDEATPAQRALVEASPETLDAVEHLGQVRVVLGATAPEASLSERENHLAAALDVWQRASDLERSGEATPSDGVDAAAAAAVTTPISTSRRARRERRTGLVASQWVLGAAAALVVVAGVGVVLREVLTDEGTDSTEFVAESVSDEAATEVDALEAAEAEEVRGGNVGDEPPTNTDLSEVAAESGGLFEDEVTAAEEADDAGSADAAASAPGQEQPAPAPEIALIEIETPDDLGVYGSLAVPTLEGDAAAEVDADFEPPFGSCAAELRLQRELEPVIYQGVDVGVGIDLDNSVVIAYDLDSCAVVATAALPTPSRTPTDSATITQP